MDYQNTYYELGEYANDLIRSKARTLIGKAGFTSADCEDIEQELALDLLVRLEHYDPKKSKRSTFMTRVVEHRIATLRDQEKGAHLCLSHTPCHFFTGGYWVFLLRWQYLPTIHPGHSYVGDAAADLILVLSKHLHRLNTIFCG